MHLKPSEQHDSVVTVDEGGVLLVASLPSLFTSCTCVYYTTPPLNEVKLLLCDATRAQYRYMVRAAAV